PVLLQRAADQEARAAHQQGGQPENGKDLPEQPHGSSCYLCSSWLTLRSLPRLWRRSCRRCWISLRRCSRSSCNLLRCSAVRMASTCSCFSCRRAFIFSKCC